MGRFWGRAGCGLFLLHVLWYSTSSNAFSTAAFDYLCPVLYGAIKFDVTFCSVCSLSFCSKATWDVRNMVIFKHKCVSLWGCIHQTHIQRLCIFGLYGAIQMLLLLLLLYRRLIPHPEPHWGLPSPTSPIPPSCSLFNPSLPLLICGLGVAVTFHLCCCSVHSIIAI